MAAHGRLRFTLLDAMALVAGVAVGLGLVLALSPTQFLLPFVPVGPGLRWTPKDWASWAVETANNRFYYLMPLLASLTVTVLLLRLRPPRPSFARLMRQPGTTTMVITSTMAVVLVPFLAFLAIWEYRYLDQRSTQYVYMTMATNIATGVASSWITLLIGGRWRADAGWIDRLGRLLGVLWIVPFFLWAFKCLLLKM